MTCNWQVLKNKCLIFDLISDYKNYTLNIEVWGEEKKKKERRKEGRQAGRKEEGKEENKNKK